MRASTDLASTLSPSTSRWSMAAGLCAALTGCSAQTPEDGPRGAEPTALLAAASAQVDLVAASAQVDLVAASARAPWAAMRVLALDEGAAHVVSDDAGAFHPLPFTDVRFLRWNGDARSIIGARGDIVVRCEVAPTQGEPCRPLFEVKDLWRLSSGPSARRVLAVPGQGKEAWVFDTATGQRRSTPAREGAWLDDRRIAYVPYPAKQLHVWDTETESDSTLGAPLDVPEMRDLVPSPDARWIAVVTRRPEARANGSVASFYGLAIQDARTGAWMPRFESTGQQIRPDGLARGAPPIWSPDGARLVQVDEGHLTVLEGPEFRPRVLDTKAHVALGWLDATRVAFLVVDHVDDAEVRSFGHGVAYTYSDVVVIDVDTGASAALTKGGPLQGASFIRVP